MQQAGSPLKNLNGFKPHEEEKNAPLSEPGGDMNKNAKFNG